MVRHDGESGGTVQNVYELIAVLMAFSGTFSGKTPGEDAAVTERGQYGERRLGFGFSGVFVAPV
jgi:hypothetical protein